VATAVEGVCLKVLASALACSPTLGSEGLVAYRTLEALREHFRVEAVTSAGMQTPQGVGTHAIDVQLDEPNDVGPASLLAYEMRQRSVVKRLIRGSQFHVLHRVTPSGYKDSLLAVPGIPLVLGPVLAADPPPDSFKAIFGPRLPRQLSLRALRHRFANGIARRIFQRFSTSSQLLQSAALILVGTEVTRRRLPEQLRARARLITYAGVEYDQFTPPAAGRLPQVPRLLFAGRLVPYKGVELLLRAAAVARQRCAFRLTIVGRGFPPYVRYCRQLVADLNLGDLVTFVEHVPRDQLVEMYRATDIFCMPSIETYGVAILEAMSCGCAVLVADANGPGEIVQPGSGVKVLLEQPEQFIRDYAARIAQLVGDTALRRRLGGEAREHVTRHHDWKRIGNALREIYAEIACNPTQQPASAPTLCRSS
jgi:glycosyltransferase involved in cell wall biosynthesis